MTTHEIPKLDNKGLRDFGLLIGGIIAGAFGLLIPVLRGHAIPWWPWAIGGVLGGLGLVSPQLLNPVYYGWMRFGLLLNAIETPIILGAVFYLILMPMGVIKRLLGDDPMQRELKRTRETYRVPSKSRTKISMERPF
ncbi:MAG: SxtJ family membrane protein [Actinomycetota bacterium]